MFYTVIRQFFKGEAETHSVQIFEELNDARKRFFSVIAADLDNAEITWQAAYIITSDGLMIEGRVFDRRTEESEATNAE